MTKIDQKLVRSVVNQMRAVEAMGRVAKVMSRHLSSDIKEACERLDVSAPQAAVMNLRDSIQQFIDTAEELHEALNAIAKEHNVEVDEEDDGIIIVPQGPGPGK